MKDLITGVVLAGGEGRRMGGADKGLQPFAGRPLAAWVVERLRPQVGRLLISANRNQERYAEFGCPVLGDLTPGFAGPLAGIQSALAVTDTPLLLAAPCDSPRLPADLASRLHRALLAGEAEIAIPVAAGRAHRAFCLLRRELAPCLDAFLAAGGRRLGEWQATRLAVEVDFDDAADAFANINTAEDLAAGDSAAAAACGRPPVRAPRGSIDSAR